MITERTAKDYIGELHEITKEIYRHPRWILQVRTLSKKKLQLYHYQDRTVYTFYETAKRTLKQ